MTSKRKRFVRKAKKIEQLQDKVCRLRMDDVRKGIRPSGRDALLAKLSKTSFLKGIKNRSRIVDGAIRIAKVFESKFVHSLEFRNMTSIDRELAERSLGIESPRGLEIKRSVSINRRLKPDNPASKDACEWESFRRSLRIIKEKNRVIQLLATVNRELLEVDIIRYLNQGRNVKHSSRTFEIKRAINYLVANGLLVREGDVISLKQESELNDESCVLIYYALLDIDEKDKKLIEQLKSHSQALTL